MQPLTWIKHYPARPLIWHTGFLASILLTVAVKWLFVIPAVLFGLISIIYWITPILQFRLGYANPGVVIALNPTLVAVSVDLTKDLGSYPVIRIIKVPLTKSRGAKLAVGDRLATTGVFMKGKNADHYWEDFDYFPADCGTSDHKAIEQLLNNFAEEEWTELERQLKQVPQPYRPGLYKVDIGNSSW